jgi:choline-sulfatase
MSDQHSLHFLGGAGEPIVRTPNLDRLAEGGVRFERAYCGNPLCVPSRMTFLTSRHGSDIGVWTNGSVLRSDIPTFAHSLGAAGYEAVLCGRMHFHHADHRHGFEVRLIGDVTGQWPGTRGPNLDPIPMSTTGQSRAAVETAGPGRSGYQAFDRAVTDGAVQYLREKTSGGDERPFCLVVGYVLPHCPFVCPKALFDEYYAKIDVPRIPEEERANLHPAIAAWRRNRGVDDLSDEQVRTARAAYYGLVTMTDAYVGEVLSALEETGLTEDTAVFYTSDHGDMAGEHEMWWKSSFYEGSVGVPLIASWPGHFAQGTVIPEPASLLDLGVTFAEMGGGMPLPFASGRSLTALLQGDGTPEDWSGDVFSECSGGRGDAPSRMVVRWPWKLIHYHGYDEPQLFNLQDDPGELTDLRKEPSCADIREELHALVREGWSGERIIEAGRAEAAYRKIMVPWAQAVKPPEPDHWLEPEGCNVFPEE